MDDRKLSKALSYYLRHAPHEIGLQLQAGGWVEMSDLVQRLAHIGMEASVDDLRRVTQNSDKRRFAIDGQRMRANQGHSVEVDLDLEPGTPPQVLYHGTPRKNLGSIFEHGLLKGERHHVHLSPDPGTAAQVGQRRGKPVILHIQARQMHEQGHTFYCSANGVWLTERVPPQYLQEPPART